MNDEQYLNTAGNCWPNSPRRCCTHEHLPEDDPLRELAAAFQALATASEDFTTKGPALVDRLFTTYPDFAPTFPRELLWFFGGDCLHYMPDEEIAQFQQLEEMRLRGGSRGRNLQSAGRQS